MNLSLVNYKNEILHLEKQLNLFEEIILALAPNKIVFLELTAVIGPMLKLNFDTGKTIKLLAENNHLRDLIILTRPFVESIINVGFICARGDDAIKSSKKYAFQKGYRDMFRELNVHEIAIKNWLVSHKDKIDQHRPQALVNALKEYTTAKGNEINSWTGETAKQKVEVISKRFGLMVNGLLTFAFFNTYRDVSEIIHGSYYGVLIMTGMQNRDITSFKSADDAATYFTDHQFKLATLSLQQVCISIVSMIDILNQEFNRIATINEIRQKSYNTMTEYADAALNQAE
jgi:hypothetical protein